MSLGDLQKWLIDEGLAPELRTLARLVAVSEIDNIKPSADLDGVDGDIEWERTLLGASILGRSTERTYQEAALRVATAALTLNTTGKVRDGGAILFDKLANARAVQLGVERGKVAPDLEGRLGVAARLESQVRRLEHSVLIESTGERLAVNLFQKQFWEEADLGCSWLSASAPTASGKTFMLLVWLLDQIIAGHASTVIYIAPTRALVSEIEDSLNALVKYLGVDSVDVTSLPTIDAYQEATKAGRSLVMVYTQERLHLLLNRLAETAAIHFLIVDEAHKIGDSQRGVILQDAIERVARRDEKTRIFFISPSTQNPGELLRDAPVHAVTLAIDSDVPTVLQNVIVATQVPRKPANWQLKLRYGEELLDLGVVQLPSRPNGLRKRLAFIAASAGARGGTLVYTNGAAEAEEVAHLISQLVTFDGNIDPELAALADLARRGVHPRYQLAPLVERGVAFHYGNMPSLIRSEIERLFRVGKIKFLACTSTLIEGVNLSCRTIVVRGPRKGMGNPMQSHDFWNLAGRAGRWGDEFQGNIICIDPDDDKAWPEGVPMRKRFPIKREVDAVLDCGTEFRDFLRRRTSLETRELGPLGPFEQTSAYLLAARLRDGSIPKDSLLKRHPPEDVSAIAALIDGLAEGIDLPSELYVQHAGVNPIGLQNLLSFFRAYEGDPEDLLLAPPESVDSYSRLMAAMDTINRLVFPAFQPPGLTPLHTRVVLEWLRGFSIATIIKRRIEYQQRRSQEIDLPTLIRSTLELIEQTARFRAPKYVAAYNHVADVYLRSIGRADLIDEGLDLGIALEFGVSAKTLMSLMELGLSRMSAVALYELIAKDDLDKEGCRAWVAEHRERLEVTQIPRLIAREVIVKLLGEEPDSPAALSDAVNV